jgi:predicted secreted Zn-dependent protease/LysM repeat protein
MFDGLGLVAQAVVIASVLAVLLLGVVVLAQRETAVAEWAEASARAVALAEQDQAGTSEGAQTSTPQPAPDAAGPGTYTVQVGDSLFSVAADLGLSPNELVFWNKDTYPTIQTTPALKAGWVLATTGPPLPTRPTPTPRPIAPGAPPAQVAARWAPGLPSFGSEAFPASGSVTVSTYAASGSTPRQIFASMDANGPWSEWAGENAQAAVQANPSFNFTFRTDASGCRIVPTGGDWVTIAYEVILPSWIPPADVSQRTVDWWIDTIHETVAHEAHHIALYEEARPLMNEAVVGGTCESVGPEIQRIWTDAQRANCEFDLAEYGYAAGLTLEACVAQ